MIFGIIQSSQMIFINNEILFGSLTNLFIGGWLAIFVAAFLGKTNNARKHLLLVGGRIIPLFLLLAFILGWLSTRDLPGSITSYEGVLLSYSVPEKVLFAWFEVLGLALLVARWIVEDSSENDSPKLALAIGLIGTFIAAAIGLVVYLVLSRTWAKLANRSIST